MSTLDDRARMKLDFLVGWLLSTGFGVDWTTRERLPAWLRDELAVRLSAIEHCSVGEADGMLRQEQAWDDDKAAQ